MSSFNKRIAATAIRTRAGMIAEHVRALGLAGVLEHGDGGPVGDFEYSIREAMDDSGLSLEAAALRVQDTHVELAMSSLARA
jgi:hypothetical protein